MSYPFKNIIPDKFNIAGMEYKVVRQSEQKGGTKYGMMNNIKNEVVLFEKMDDTPISFQQAVQTFWHEIVHGILDNMGETELSNNEKFVCTFSSMLNEIMQSAYKQEIEFERKEPWEE